MAKSSFDRIYKKCQDRDICDCGETELCYNEDGEMDECSAENCPKLKNKKRHS
jgi:hypothetical protein